MTKSVSQKREGPQKGPLFMSDYEPRVSPLAVVDLVVDHIGEHAIDCLLYTSDAADE